VRKHTIGCCLLRGRQPASRSPRRGRQATSWSNHEAPFSEARRYGCAGSQHAGAAAIQPLQMLHRFLSDPKVKHRTIAGTRMLDGAIRICITSDAGTDTTLDKSGRPAVAHYSCADESDRLDL